MFYKLHGPKLWGDLGDVLIRGECVFGEELDPLTGIGFCTGIERAGPFVPPVMCSRVHLFLSESGRAVFEKDFPDYEYRHIPVTKAVDLNWETWDWSKPPAVWPDGPEPTDYIHMRPHDSEVASKCEAIYEVLLPLGIKSDVVPTEVSWKKRLVVDLSTWNGMHFLRTKPRHFSIVIVSGEGKQWLESHWSKWVSFEEAGSS